MNSFFTIGLIVLGSLLFLTQFFNYYYHIGKNKDKIKSKVISLPLSTKLIAAFTALYWLAFIWMIVIKLELLMLLLLLFICVQFTFAVFLTSNVFIFEDYLLVPWRNIEFKNISALKVVKGKRRSKLVLNYEGKVFKFSLKESDLAALLTSIKSKNKKLFK